MVAKIIPLLVFMMSFLSCNNESPSVFKPIDTSSGPESSGSGDKRIQSIAPVKIQGKWKFLKKINSASESVPLKGMDIYFEIDANQFYSWVYYPLFPNSSNCISRTISPYTLQGDLISGENFEGVQEVGGQVLSWNTTVEIDGDNLVIKTNYYDGESKRYSESMVYELYNGTVPPEDWPDEECQNGQLAKR